MDLNPSFGSLIFIGGRFLNHILLSVCKWWRSTLNITTTIFLCIILVKQQMVVV